VQDNLLSSGSASKFNPDFQSTSGETSKKAKEKKIDPIAEMNDILKGMRERDCQGNIIKM
jgi:hypothetical protein